MSSSKTPCAACKLQRRKCTQECIFAPYFPPDNPRKFHNVHQVFGASNVSKLLSELNVAQREEAVRSLAYEAEARLRDPVYGCVGLISVLQQRLRQVQNEVDKARKELATYIGPQALQPMVPVLDPHHGMVPLQPHHQGNIYGPSVFPYNNMPPLAMAVRGGGGQLVIREPQQQQREEQQMLGSQLATDMEVRQVKELFGIYDQQQQQPPPPPQQQKEFMRYGGGGGVEMGSVSGSGFNQPPEMSPSLALNTYDNPYHSVQLQQGQGGDHYQQNNQRHHLQEQMLLPPQQPAQQNQPLHHQLQEQLLLSPQQLQSQPPHHQLQEQILLPQQQPQPQQQQQQHQHHHHQLQEQLFLRSQQPQPRQDQHQHQHHQLQEQLLLPPQQPQPQQQHQEQSEVVDGRSVSPS